jgi:predicted HTH transcriptional regulator
MTTESNRVEFKRKLNDRFERSVVSFLNYPGGGEILVGIDNDGSVAGVAQPDTEQLKIVDRIKNNIRPNTLGLFDVIHEHRAGKDILRVVVSCGMQRPYYIRQRGMAEDGCFIRVGSASQPMSEQMIERLLAKRQTASLQILPSPRNNLTFRQLKIYYEEKGLAVTDEFLRNLDLANDDGSLNYAAYLLADINGVSIKVAKYSGTDKYDLLENEEYGNRCLLTATHRVLERLEAENHTLAKIAYPTRIEKPLVDKTALREAVINAIVHNDYSLAVPLVEIFSDRIVVTSAGGLVEGLSPEDFFHCRSMPRNRVLMRVFRDLELVESLGSGMTRILRAYDRSIFELTPNFLVVTFRLPNEQTDRTKTARKPHENIAATARKPHEIGAAVLDALRADPSASTPSLAGILTVSRQRIRWQIDKLKKSGVIRHAGPAKGGHWEILKP